MQEGRQPRASGEGEREGKEKDNGDLDVSLSTQYVLFDLVRTIPSLM